MHAVLLTLFLYLWLVSLIFAFLCDNVGLYFPSSYGPNASTNTRCIVAMGALVLAVFAPFTIFAWGVWKLRDRYRATRPQLIITVEDVTPIQV